jgi:hypothetical protein
MRPSEALLSGCKNKFAEASCSEPPEVGAQKIEIKKSSQILRSFFYAV